MSTKLFAIPLQNDMNTYVDLVDYDLKSVKWSAAEYKGKFYAQRAIGKRPFRTTEKLHTRIMERVLGRGLIKGETVDHIDHDGLNNCRDNLRLASYLENSQNQKMYKNNKSGYKGVSWRNREQKWWARIKYNGKSIDLGYFDTAEDASKAYEKKAKELRGKFYSKD